jgi:Prion-inhibition and propagation
MDTAGFVLGTASLSGQLFAGCANAYSLFATAQGASQDISIAEWKLRIEDARFRLWGKAWGFTNEEGGQS